MKISVARTLEKLNLEPIILHEPANEGKTIIESFEKHSEVGFAISLLSPDDKGYSKRDLVIYQKLFRFPTDHLSPLCSYMNRLLPLLQYRFHVYFY